MPPSPLRTWGFNLCATLVRQNWKGKVVRHIFESPPVRLMKDYGYRDIYAEGREKKGRIPAKSIIIHRYYEQADTDPRSSGHMPGAKRSGPPIISRQPWHPGAP